MNKLKRCVICGFDKKVHKHHIIKRRNCGSDEEENLTYLCLNHHWIADFGEEEDRKEILRLINELTGKIGCKISNKEMKVLDLKIRVLQEETFKDAVWEDKWWEKHKETSNYLTNRAWLLGRSIPPLQASELNERAEKLILIKLIRDSLPLI